MTSGKISIDLLPDERAVLRKWTFLLSDLESQLAAVCDSEGIETVTISLFALNLLLSDLCHAIVDRRCRDTAVRELYDRLNYVEQTGDGELFYLR